ncbi:MAG: MFS transporter [Alphaproteobacteria bacterium]|nr:MFS transporter [Alphaproteobacteria bacterium]
MAIDLKGARKRPEILLLLMATATPLAFSVWQALLNNFAVERAAFTGVEMGILQSIREVPGFLSFAVVFLLLVMREQRLAFLSLLLLGIGTAVTGLFPSVVGLLVTTMIMSVGFHYYETVQQSLALQWLDRKTAAQWLGRFAAAGSFAAIAAYGLTSLSFRVLELDYVWIYAIGGGATIVIAVLCWTMFPTFHAKVPQRKQLVFRSRYWLYYGLVFMSGARRQIFLVFATFMLVERFKFDASEIPLIFLVGSACNMVLAPRIGRLIDRWGERPALTIEAVSLIVIFLGYAVVDNRWAAAGLYVLDFVFFAMAIAIKTYFQKIGDPADIAPTAGVSFTINHIAAVILPFALGFLWVISPTAVFVAGSGFAVVSLILSRLVPADPGPGRESLSFRRFRPAATAAE